MMIPTRDTDRIEALQKENEALRATLAHIGVSVTAALNIPRDTLKYTQTLSDIKRTTESYQSEHVKQHTTIYCFVNNTHPQSTDVQVVAVCECGRMLAEHQSSNRDYALHDIGITSTWKHDAYLKHYAAMHGGKAYTLVWIDDPQTATHPGFLQLQQLFISRI